MYIKLDTGDSEQISFLKKELRPYYDGQVLLWQYNRWQNLNSCLYLLKKDNQYIASQGMIPLHLITEGKIRLTAKSETSFLLPDYRGKGLFEELYFHAIDKSEEDNTELIWGFTALSNVWRKKLKFDVSDGLITETELPLSMSNGIRSALKKNTSISNLVKLILKTILNNSKKKRIPSYSKKKLVKEIDFSRQKNIDAVLNTFTKWRANYPAFISINLDADFIEWRLLKNPMLHYKIIGFYEGNELYGFAIINDSESYAYLTEFIVDDRTKLKEGLFSFLTYWKGLKKSSYLNYWASNQNEYSKEISNVLSELGAIKIINNHMNFVCKKTKHNSFDTKDISSFYINGLWTEGFNI
jgi:hypothetical protein